MAYFVAYLYELAHARASGYPEALVGVQLSSFTMGLFVTASAVFLTLAHSLVAAELLTTKTKHWPPRPLDLVLLGLALVFLFIGWFLFKRRGAYTGISYLILWGAALWYGHSLWDHKKHLHVVSVLIRMLGLTVCLALVVGMATSVAPRTWWGQVGKDNVLVKVLGDVTVFADFNKDVGEYGPKFYVVKTEEIGALEDKSSSALTLRTAK